MTEFFEQLEAIDCSSIKEVKPDEPTEGGGNETYSIVYVSDKTFYLKFGSGSVPSGYAFGPDGGICD